MKLTFRSLAVLCAFVCFALGITWAFSPELLLSMWGVEYSYPVALVGRRGAALFVGIGVMFYLARNSEPSPARSALTTGFVVGCLALAVSGIFEFVTGHAGIGILSAAFVEITIAVALIHVSGDTFNAASH